MNTSVQIQLQEYAAAKRRLSIQLELLESLKALHSQIRNIAPESCSALRGQISAAETLVCEMVGDLFTQLGQVEALVQQAESPLYKEILERHYLQQESFRDIAAATHYSERHIRRLHRAALEQLSVAPLPDPIISQTP